MFNAFFVVFRESAELLICVAALRACLQSRMPGGRDAVVAAGCAAGAAIALGLLATLSGVAVDPRLSPLLTIAFAVTMMLMAVGMLTSVGSLRESVSSWSARWLDRACHPLVIGGFAAFITSREILEVVLFLQGAWQEAADPAQLLQGAALGVGLAAGLLAAYPFVARSRPTRWMLHFGFRLSALLLAVVAVELLVGGLADFVSHHGDAHPDSLIASAGNVLLDGSTREALLAALLMLLPAVAFVRSWWNEASDA